VGKAGAAALTRLPNKHFLCAAWSDSDENPVRLDLYLSSDTTLTKGFGTRPRRQTWPFSCLTPTGGRRAEYQSIAFIHDDRGGLYLIGTENLTGKAPFDEKDDVADLLQVDLPARTLAVSPTLKFPNITRIAEKRFSRSKPYANFDAATGVYVDTETRRLFLYAGYHWRRDGNRLHYVEFTPGVPYGAPALGAGAAGWIELFDDRSFRGRRLTVRTDDTETDIEDYNTSRVQDEGFGDDVASARYQLPPGNVYRLFKNRGFQPQDRETIDLTGTGQVVEIPDISVGHNFDVGVSSSKLLP
jgi:hypothetical protein